MQPASPLPSMLNRLLEEISWEGAKVRDYRSGGSGRENVLTAEVLMPLDFLPRISFLGEVLVNAHGADAARAEVASEVEELQIELLPSELMIRPPAPADGPSQVVQPDAVMVGPSTYVLVEAKRIKSSSFGPEQLAREYAALMQVTHTRTPLLLLLLGAPPPIDVRSRGRLELTEAVAAGLEPLLLRTGMDAAEAAAAEALVPEVLAWITWTEIRDVVSRQRKSCRYADASVGSAVGRLAASLDDAIARHS